MKRLIFSILATVLMAVSAPAIGGELKMADITVMGICDNWVSFPKGSWTNNTGNPVYIKSLKSYFVGAASLIGEPAGWMVHPNPSGFNFAQAGVVGDILYSFGAEVYVPPSQPVMDTMYFGSDQITVAPGGTIYWIINCGPVNLPAGGQSPQMSYVGVLRFWYTQ